ncbi:MAG: hypothetical protein ACRBEQ_14685 [Hyphomonas sp.]
MTTLRTVRTVFAAVLLSVAVSACSEPQRVDEGIKADKDKREDLASKRVDGIVMEQTRCNTMGGCSGVETDSAGDSAVVLDQDW